MRGENERNFKRQLRFEGNMDIDRVVSLGEGGIGVRIGN
jgi:hypothetical protein